MRTQNIFVVACVVAATLQLGFAPLYAQGKPSAQACPKTLSVMDRKPLRFSGVLLWQQKYGPPNYGENPKTDSKVHIWVIRLDRPISVLTGPDVPTKAETGTLTEMQISGETVDQQAFKKLQGKHVSISGTLRTWLTAGDMTKALVEAKSVIADTKTGCPE